MRGRKGDYKEQQVAGGRWQVAGCLRGSGQSQHTVHALTVNSCGQDTTGRERGRRGAVNGPVMVANTVSHSANGGGQREDVGRWEGARWEHRT